MDFDLNELPSNMSSSSETKQSTFIANFDQSSDVQSQVPSNKKKNLTVQPKRVVVEMLLQESKNGKIPRGGISKVADLLSISIRSISCIWNKAKSSLKNGIMPSMSSNFVKRVGRKRVELGLQRIKDVPFCRRTNIRSLSKALNVAKSIIHRRIKEGHIRPHSNPLKPYLSDENKRKRLEFCLSMIDEGTCDSTPSLISMHNYIHIDEKWFYMSKTSHKYYLHLEEKEPLRTCKSKRFITKIMFLAVVARPRYDASSGMTFDGKIGIWPFMINEPAKRSSKNRKAGTLEMKPILSVTKEVIRSCVINNLLPAIRDKWPPSSSKTIFIQQDNVRPHIDVTDPEFIATVTTDEFDIRLFCQPPNSPKLNVLDLGFFRAIDSLRHQEAPSNIEELVSAVENAFQKFPSEDLNNVFLTLQSCMQEVLKNLGGNNYKNPHMNNVFFLQSHVYKLRKMAT